MTSDNRQKLPVYKTLVDRSNLTQHNHEKYKKHNDSVVNGKPNGKCPKSFTLWQQATIEITLRVR